MNDATDSFRPAGYSLATLAVAVLVQCAAALFHEGDWAFALGGLLAAVPVFLFVAYVAGRFVWENTGRRRTPASVTITALALVFIAVKAFGVIHAAMDSGEADAPGEKRQSRSAIETIQAANEATPASPEDRRANEVLKRLEEFGQRADGDDAQVAAILVERSRIHAAQSEAWRDSADAIDALDIQEMIERNSYGQGLEIVARYIQLSGKRKVVIQTYVESLREALTPLGLDRESVQKALKGAQSRMDRDQEAYVALLESHTQAGVSMRALLEFLRDSAPEWNRDRGGPSFREEGQVATFEELGAELFKRNEELERRAEICRALQAH